MFTCIKVKFHIPNWGEKQFFFWFSRVDFRQKKVYFPWHLYWVFNDISEDISKKKNVHRLMHVNVCRTRCWLGFFIFFSTWKCESLLWMGRNKHISFWIPFYMSEWNCRGFFYFFDYLYRNLLPNSRFTIMYREKIAKKNKEINFPNEID